MEMTYEEAIQKLDAALAEQPEVFSFITSPDFGLGLNQILSLNQLNPVFRDQIEFEIKMILGYFSPLKDLATRIVEATDISQEKADDVALMIQSQMLSPFIERLIDFEILLESESKESSASTVNLHTPPQTLTKDALMKALETKRTMKGDIEVMRQKLAEAALRKPTQEEYGGNSSTPTP
jgi:hypothetical protein